MYEVTQFDNTKIKETRIGKGLTRGKVASKARVHESTVYRLEKLGQGHIEKVGRILKVLGLAVTDVVIEDRKTA